MTKEDVIEKLRNDEQYAKGRPLGYMLMAIGEDDLDAYMPAYMERYRKLPPRQQRAFLSWLADGMYGMLEDAPEYGVKQLMLDTLSATDAVELDSMLKREADVDSVLKDNTQVRIWRKALPKGAWLEVYSNNTYDWSATLKDGNQAHVAAAYNMSLASVAVGEILRALLGQGYDADVTAAVEKLHYKLLAKEDEKDSAIEAKVTGTEHGAREKSQEQIDVIRRFAETQRYIYDFADWHYDCGLSRYLIGTAYPETVSDTVLVQLLEVSGQWLPTLFVNGGSFGPVDPMFRDPYEALKALAGMSSKYKDPDVARGFILPAKLVAALESDSNMNQPKEAKNE